VFLLLKNLLFLWILAFGGQFAWACSHNPKSGASANSATFAIVKGISIVDDGGLPRK